MRGSPDESGPQFPAILNARITIAAATLTSVNETAVLRTARYRGASVVVGIYLDASSTANAVLNAAFAFPPLSFEISVTE